MRLWFIGIFPCTNGFATVSTKGIFNSAYKNNLFVLYFSYLWTALYFYFHIDKDVFRPAKQFGAFKSVILTFLVSSMLHGMNFNLTMVLLSLGFYTYVEYTLREKLATIFDACIRSRSCSPTCQHSLKSNNPIVIAANTLFGCWAYFHLAYLGVMMDKSHIEEDQSQGGLLGFISVGLKRWDDLGYASHWAMIIVFIGNMVI